MKKIASYILSTIFYFFYSVLLLIFHSLQWLGFNIGKYKGHKIAVDLMNCTLTYILYLLGTKITFINKHSIPKNVPLIIVSNHQSMHDICPLSCYLKKYHPKFVSKIELGKGIPSVSFNLRHGGAALINRKEPKQAITALENFGKRIHENNWSAAIFPEGTRSRDGHPKKFSINGLKTIIKHNPNAYVVPVSINNSWKVFKYGGFPLGMFHKIELQTHEPIHLQNQDIEKVLSNTEKIIKEHIYTP